MPRLPSRPYWTAADGETVRLYQGHAVDVLRRMPSGFVQTVITSPPYWGLRDYGTDKCLEIGGEDTVSDYADKIVEVFRMVRRILRDDGTVWLNLGDSYSSSGVSGTGTSNRGGIRWRLSRRAGGGYLSAGNLVGAPWRVALALQRDGWILRQDIIWHKPSPLPESVTNRCTKSHEYLFLLSKKSGYYCDMDAIKEDSVTDKFTEGVSAPGYGRSGNPRLVGHRESVGDSGGTRNKRSVWTIATGNYSGAHFAVFPKKLVEPCVLAGTSEHGCCVICSAPWRRIVERKKLIRKRPNEYVKRTGEPGTGNLCANTVAGVRVRTLGWEATCGCNTAEVQPCTVLDPFIGSGTTAVVAVSHGRRCWGIDLSRRYLANNAIPRIEGELLGRPALAHLVEREREMYGGGRKL